MADVHRIRRALRKRKQDIAAQIETMSMKEVRRMIEADLGLPKDTLKAMKEELNQLVDEEILKDLSPPSGSGGAAEEAEEEPPQKRSKTEKAAKAQKAAKPNPSAPTRSKKGVPAAAASSKPKHSVYVEKLKKVCKQAGIPVGPSVYAQNKDNDSLAAALEGLLQPHGLGAGSDARSIDKVRREREKAKDLEGIDTANIVSYDGRRPRRAAAAAVDFSHVFRHEPAGSDEDGSDDSEDDAPRSGAKKRAAAAAPPSSSSGGSGGDSSGRSWGSASGDEKGEEDDSDELGESLPKAKGRSKPAAKVPAAAANAGSKKAGGAVTKKRATARIDESEEDEEAVASDGDGSDGAYSEGSD